MKTKKEPAPPAEPPAPPPSPDATEPPAPRHAPDAGVKEYGVSLDEISRRSRSR